MKFLFLSLKGRISRKSWWIATLALTVLETALSILLIWSLGGSPGYYWNDQPMSPAIPLAEALTFLLLLRLFLAIDIKRIHDRGLSAYYIVPMYLSWLLLIAVEGVYTQSFFELPYWQWLFWPMLAYHLWIIFELGFRKGTNGASKYGADPLEHLAERDA